MTGRVLNGLSSIVSDCIGEGNPEKTGGVEAAPRKRPSFAPFALLHGAQHATRLSRSCVPPALRGIT